MRQRTFRKRALVTVLLAVGALVPYLAFWGCGSGGYDAPSNTTSSALLSVETLKSWIDQGKVNNNGYDEVVILDVSSDANYNDGHIPGAQVIYGGTDVMQTRIEGVAPSVNMVAEGSRMDAMIQRTGIGPDTTIVITSEGAASSIMQATRAYFTFRYWGFPKERLKVLDGGYIAWNAAYPGTLETAAPTVTPSTYSVRDLGALNAGCRASLGEMMIAAADNDPDTVILDTRSGELAGGYTGAIGSTTGVFPPGGDYAAFEGHMREGRALAYSTLLSNGSFLPTDNLVTLFSLAGVDSSKTAYVYCRTGVIASVEFFVMDGILGWTPVLYDGSWSQWGAMAVNTKGGPLASTSAWRTDTATYSDLVNYSIDNTVSATPETVAVDNLAIQMFTTVSDPAANQIEKEDAEYISGGGGTSGGGTTGGGGGGGC